MKIVSRIRLLLSTIVFGLISVTPSIFGQITLYQHAASATVQQLYTEPDTSFTSQSNSTSCFNTKHRNLKSMVSFGILNSKAIDIPKPDYPKAAKAANFSGEVKVIIIVDRKGAVAWAQIENGNQMLQTAVKEVVCQARFRPQILSGKPVSFFGLIIYNFTI